MPGPIDLPSFEGALGRTLSAFPLYAGHIRRPAAVGGKWQVGVLFSSSDGFALKPRAPKVSLCNHGVQVFVEESEAERTVPIDTIIQAPFMLSKKLAVHKYWQPDSQEPLLRVTLTRFVKTGDTSIGFSASHAVGKHLSLTANV